MASPHPLPAFLTVPLAAAGLVFAAGDPAPEAVARELARRLDRAWAGLAAAPAGRGSVPDAVARVLDEIAGDDDPARRARQVGLALARRFDGWFADEVRLPPPLADRGEPPAEAWAAEARRRLVREEAQALAEALDEQDAAGARDAALAVARIRFRRAALLPASALDRLRFEETREGLALWTVLRGFERADAATLSGAAPLARALRARIGSVIERVAGGGASAPPAVTGCAIALLLDRAQPGWQDDWLARQVPLDAMLAGPPFGGPGR